MYKTMKMLLENRGRKRFLLKRLTSSLLSGSQPFVASLSLSPFSFPSFCVSLLLLPPSLLLSLGLFLSCSVLTPAWRSLHHQAEVQTPHKDPASTAQCMGDGLKAAAEKLHPGSVEY